MQYRFAVNSGTLSLFRSIDITDSLHICVIFQVETEKDIYSESSVEKGINYKENDQTIRLWQCKKLKKVSRFCPVLVHIGFPT